MATAGDQINGALRLLGVLAEGETPSSEMADDALMALNQMIDSWSAERLSIFSTQDQILTWPASTQSRTLGPTGTLVGNRPITLDDSTYFRDPTTGISYGLKIVNQQQYNGIAVKTVTSTYPQIIFINDTYPDAEISVYPVPTRALEFHFVSVEPLTQSAVLASDLLIPPGYLRAFRYNLACEIASEYGIEPTPTIQRVAMVSKRTIKRNNNPNDVMSIPYSIVGTRQRFNIFAGNF
jgi:hypothetical protein